MLAEIAALHPKLPVVFAGNRKLANHWALRWFAAVAADDRALPLFMTDALARWDGVPEASLDERIRAAALVQLGPAFTAAEIASAVPDADTKRIARVLRSLRTEQRLRTVGRGRATRWQRTQEP